MSLWRNRALPSKLTLASSTRMRPFSMTISGLTSSIDMSFSTKALCSAGNRVFASSRAAPSSFRASDRVATSASVTPATGSMTTVRMRSGVSWATCSMSMPPSVETTKATFPWVRSTRIDR